MSARKTPQDYHDLAATRGFVWLGPEVENSETKTFWRCSQGHIWETKYQVIQMGYGCPHCAGLAKKTPQDYYDLAATRGFVWLGPEVLSVTIKTEWQCQAGHTWKAVYPSIKKGSGCPHCSGNAPKTPQDYHDLATKRGFVWLGPEAPNIQTKTSWQCKNGHTWAARYNDIQSGYGCLRCAGKIPKTPQDYHDLAAARGFVWLGPEAPNTQTKTSWQCKNGHTWTARYNDIQRGYGCPYCVHRVNGFTVSQVQIDLHEMTGGSINHLAGRRAIDIALEIGDERFAIEYDSWYWHANKEAGDKKRDAYLIKHGWRILRIKSNTKLPTREQLDAAIAQLISGDTYAEIVLDDWGHGPAFHEGD